MRGGIVAVVVTLLLGFMHGFLRAQVGTGSLSTVQIEMYATWCSDLRFTFEQLIYCAAILFVGARFFESRMLLTIGFDLADAKKVGLKGPDSENTVWIGHRYSNAIEAQAVADALAEQLRGAADPGSSADARALAEK
ncbi:MAG TPA: hypothetical protein VGG10_23150 [Rhizomicrobium sp.]